MSIVVPPTPQIAAGALAQCGSPARRTPWPQWRQSAGLRLAAGSSPCASIASPRPSSHTRRLRPGSSPSLSLLPHPRSHTRRAGVVSSLCALPASSRPTRRFCTPGTEAPPSRSAPQSSWSCSCQAGRCCCWLQRSSALDRLGGSRGVDASCRGVAARKGWG